jgi:hypothetical protein
MKTKYKILMLFAATAISICSHSQSLSPAVVSSAGGYFNSSSATLSYTVAEMTMVQTFTSANNILTQGFQQPIDLTVGMTENSLPANNVLVFPNPTSGLFALSYVSSGSKNDMIKIYDLVGQVVLTKILDNDAGSKIVNLDISKFSEGVYLLELTTYDSKGTGTSCINKINSVH